MSRVIQGDSALRERRERRLVRSRHAGRLVSFLVVFEFSRSLTCSRSFHRCSWRQSSWPINISGRAGLIKTDVSGVGNRPGPRRRERTTLNAWQSPKTKPILTERLSEVQGTKTHVTASPYDGNLTMMNNVADPSLLPLIMRNTTALEMNIMSAVGFCLSAAVIVSLASGQVEPTVQMDALKDLAGQSDNALVEAGLGLVEGGVEDLEVLSRSILSAAMPQSATDVLAVALGEGIAGALGALATWLVGAILRLRSEANEAAARVTVAMSDAMDVRREDVPILGGLYQRSPVFDGTSKSKLISKAVADGDYFFTRAAAIPLLQSVGVPTFAATFASVLIATIPYEIIKLSSRKRRLREEEDRFFEQLLREQQQQQQSTKRKAKKSFSGLTSPASVAGSPPFLKFTSEPVPFREIGQEMGNWTVLSFSDNSFNTVELFTDITKWLEYDVLMTDFSGRLTFNGSVLSPAWESAVFGFLAVLSTQLYADVIYRYTGMGTDEAREESRTRTFDEWTSLYVAKCLSGAALFGVYESVRLPISQFIQRLLAGAVDGCLGSQNIDLCVETFVVDNPPGASFEARLRSFIVAVVSIGYRFGSELDDRADLQGWGRSILVHFYSQIGNFLGFADTIIYAS